jgi:hypothetical protein
MTVFQLDNDASLPEAKFSHKGMLQFIKFKCFHIAAGFKACKFYSAVCRQMCPNYFATFGILAKIPKIRSETYPYLFHSLFILTAL